MTSFFLFNEKGAGLCHESVLDNIYDLCTTSTAFVNDSRMASYIQSISIGFVIFQGENHSRFVTISAFMKRNASN